MIPRAAETLYLVLLVAGVPLMSWLTMRDPMVRNLPRRSLYASAALSEWIIAVPGLGAAKLAGLGARDLGLGGVSLPAFAWWTLGLVAISAAALGLLLQLEQRGLWPDEPELVYLLIPRTAGEKAWALAMVAPTAALVEEFLYRGYLLTIVTRTLHSAAWGLGLSSVVFGLAHLYQRPSGVVRAAALGALLAWPVLRTGSLYPSMAAHFLIDAAALGWLGPRMLRLGASS